MNPDYSIAHQRGNRGAARIAVLDAGLSDTVSTHALWDFTGTGIRTDRHYGGTYHGDNRARDVAEVAPDSWLYYAKVLAPGLHDFVAPIVAGLRWALASRVDAVSMSFTLFAGHQTYPTALADALRDLIDAGIGVFAACGNDPARGAEQPWPASFPGVCRCAWDRWIPPFASACWPSGGGLSSGATASLAAAYGLWLASDNNYARTRVRYLGLANPYLYWLMVDLPRLSVDGVPYCGGL